MIMTTYLLGSLTQRVVLSLNTLDTLIYYVHILSKLLQIILQLVNIVLNSFLRNPLLIHIKTIRKLAFSSSFSFVFFLLIHNL